MSEQGIEVEVIELPEAVVVAYGTQSMRVKGTDGEEYAVVTLDLQFQIEPGKVGQQTFLFHKEDAKKLREELKNPQPQSPKEDTPS
jgi:hypothetical protein